MGRIRYLLLLLLLATKLAASTAITSATVSGHWMISNSPFLIYNDIAVPYTQTLQIDPGVEIIFEGSYKLVVNGTLFSVGNAAQHIVYHRNDTTGWSDTTPTHGGWQGILFDPTSADLSVFRYCEVLDLKHGTLDDFRPISIANCEFYHNKDGCMRINGSDSGQLVDLGYCTFHNNTGTTLLSTYGCKHYVHDDTFCNNATHCAYKDSSYKTIFANNEVYRNTQTDSVSGGLITLLRSNGQVNNNRIFKNTGMLDGMIYGKASTIEINANIICNNVVTVAPGAATAQGGAAIHINDSGATTYRTTTIRNNIIANNATAGYGAGIYIYRANAGILNNDIINNKAAKGGGIYVVDNASTGGTIVKVKNNIFFHNVDTSGGVTDTVNVYLAGIDTLLYEYNFSERSFSADVFATGSYTLTGDTLHDAVGAAPQLIAPTLTTSDTENALLANFGLLISSPCVNTGDTGGTVPSVLDYAGNARVTGTIIDIGAIESPYKLTINELENQTDFNLCPNPACQTLHCSSPSANGIVYITDVTGKIMSLQHLKAGTIAFSLSHFTKGIYFAIFESDNLCRIIKQFVVE